ncbi:MAG: hypothetical protein ACKPKO_00765, partial [Candidatus Fonsibacter sp.]
MHVINGSAVCRNSMMLQGLFAICATHPSRLSDLLMTLAPKPLTLQALRHEFLQGPLHSPSLQLEQVLFGGRLPDSFLEAGVLDHDQAHFWNIMLGKAEAQAHPRDYMAMRLKLEIYAKLPWARTTTTQQDTA